MNSNMGKVSCGLCGAWVRRKQDGQPYKHKCVSAVSDPAPTVEETTQGDDVNEIPEPHDAAKAAAQAPEKGPWFGAMYEGRCSVGECRIEEGDRIRADGEGGYECEDCGDIADVGGPRASSIAAMYSEPTEEAVTDALPDADWQAQAGAAARRHMEGARPQYEIRDEAQAFMDPAPARGVTIATGTFSPTVTADQFMDPAATEDVQPLLGVNGQPKKVRRDHMKRYAVVLPGETELEVYTTSGKPKGRTRATTFNKAASDKKAVNDWGKRNVVIGAARRRDLLLQAHGLTHEDDRDRLNAIVVELEEAAGSKVGSDLGTYLHEFTEYMDAGLKTWQEAPEEFQKSLALYAQALADAGLEPIQSLIERTTIIREFDWVCGTFDRIFYHRPSGQYVIGDLKTGKTMDYGKNEVETQLWTYAHGVNQNGVYDWNTDTWGPAVEDPLETDPEEIRPIKVSESVGVVIHMPVQGKLEGTVQLLWADLESGARHAELCHAVRSQPKGKLGAWGDGPAPLAAAREPLHDIGGGLVVRHSVTPAPSIIDWSKVDPTPWDVLFDQVRTSEEASALWHRAREAGLDRMRIQDLIGRAQTALRRLGVRG